MTPARAARLGRLREALGEQGLDALVVSYPSNILYLSGFRGSSGILVITAHEQRLLSDFRYRLQAQQQASGFDFVEVERRLYGRAGEVLQESGARRTGYDQAHLTCQQREELAAAVAEPELAPAAGLVEKLRAVKSPEELQRIRAAAALADEALATIASLLRAGAVEREVALEAEFAMRRAGAEAAAFDFIVASGPSSALPHAETTDRRMQEGDLVVVDIGGRADGYCSDMTRTFAIGSAADKARAIYRLVYEAQRAGVEAVRAGVRCGDVDRTARDIIGEGGYGEYFGHGLGHGVGIDVHEGPRLGRDEQAELVAGNVVTVEPGIYLPEFGGVRLEDLLVVTEEGSETITGSALAPELPVL